MTDNDDTIRWWQVTVTFTLQADSSALPADMKEDIDNALYAATRLVTAAEYGEFKDVTPLDIDSEESDCEPALPMDDDYQPGDEFDWDRNDARQYCRHGTFIGSWWGPDILCGQCESE